MNETNGLNGLSDARRAAIEAGMVAVAQAEHERDQLRRELEVARFDLRGLQAEHDALKLAYARQQAEMNTYRQDRDEAVSARAAFEALYDAVLQIMQKHRAAPEGGPAGGRR